MGAGANHPHRRATKFDSMWRYWRFHPLQPPFNPQKLPNPSTIPLYTSPPMLYNIPIMPSNYVPRAYQPLEALIHETGPAPGELDEQTLSAAFDPPATPGSRPITREVYEAEIGETPDPTTLTRRYMQKTMLKRAVDVYDTALDDPDIRVARGAADKVINFVLNNGEKAPASGVNLTFNLSGGPPPSPPPTVVGGETVEINEEERR